MGEGNRKVGWKARSAPRIARSEETMSKPD